MIRQVYEVDPLLFPQYGGSLKVLAVIERPAIVRQILAHLRVPTAAPSAAARHFSSAVGKSCGFSLDYS